MSSEQKYNPKKRRMSTSSSSSSKKSTGYASFIKGANAYMKGGGRGYTTVNKGLAPFAPRFITKLKYAERIAINLTAGVVSDYMYRLNSLFDPNLTGTGHQPYGFDQLAALYGRYRVFRTYYRINMYNSTGTSTQGVAILMNNSSSSVAAAGWDTVREYPRTQSAVLTSANIAPYTFKGSISLPRLNGSTSTAYKSDDRFQAQVGASPTETLIMHILNFSDTATTNTEFEVQFEYETEFFDPAVFTSS